MKVSDAVAARISTRAFLDRPVPMETVRDILDKTRRAPSGGNLQPWQVYVVGGTPLKELIEKVGAVLMENPKGEGSEYQIYPESLAEPYRSRRFKCGEDMYATIGIAREDKLARLGQFARNFEFFGAPLGLFFTIDRQMQPGQWADLGMFIQTIMLLAEEAGLKTCAQEAWAVVHKTVGAFLNLPEEQMLFCGMAVGYGDPDHPINSLRTERADLDDLTTFIGV